jgi:phosphatidate cytidylyltransferase
VGATLAGGIYFQGLIFVILVLVTWEASQMIAAAGLPPAPLFGLLAAISFPLWAITGQPAATWAGVALATVAGIAYVGIRTNRPGALTGWATSLAIGLYVGVLFTPALLLRERADGLGWVLLALLGTWSCDTAAYLVGRQWGHRPFVPSVSPRKTLEGVVAGVIATIVVCGVVGVSLGYPIVRTLGFGVVVAVGAILGDLAESVMKRQLSAKDSGWIMPGHGGMLDRIDSLLLSGCLGYLYVVLTDGRSTA